MDITYRLRMHDDHRLYHEADVLMAEAADEIDRLQGESEAYATIIQYHEVTIEKLRKQRGELLTAMNSIAKNTCCNSCQEAVLVAQTAIAKCKEES